MLEKITASLDIGCNLTEFDHDQHIPNNKKLIGLYLLDFLIGFRLWGVSQ